MWLGASSSPTFQSDVAKDVSHQLAAEENPEKLLSPSNGPSPPPLKGHKMAPVLLKLRPSRSIFALAPTVTSREQKHVRVCACARVCA